MNNTENSAQQQNKSNYLHLKCASPLSTVLHQRMLSDIILRLNEKGKERKSIYIAPFCTKVHTKRSGMDHTVLPANNTMPAFPSWRSPDATTATEAADIQLQLTTHLSTLKG